MSNLSMATPKKSNKILLIDFNKNRKTELNQLNVEYKLKTKDEGTANAWRDAIQKCLWKELLTARGQQNEIDCGCDCDIESGKHNIIIAFSFLFMSIENTVSKDLLFLYSVIYLRFF